MSFKRFLILLASVLITAGCKVTDSRHAEYIRKTIALDSLDVKGRLSWVESPPTAPDAVGIHGTPGDWTAWRGLMQIPKIKNQHFMAFDRPGWGESKIDHQDVIPEFDRQAKILAQALARLPARRPVILVAHSWGGPVALALANMHPELVGGLVLVASPADPMVSEPRWYHRIADNIVIGSLIGSALNRSNQEMLTLADQLCLLVPKLANIRQPVVIVQGEKDWLVDPENAFFMQERLTNAHVKLYYNSEANHFIPFNQAGMIADAVEWILGLQPQQVAISNSQPF